MAVYPAEFSRSSQVEVSQETGDNQTFSVLITKREIKNIAQITIAKILFYISSVCGLQMLQCTKQQKIKQISKSRQLYSLLLVTLIVFSSIFNKPVSWIDTRLDLPLNVLTKAFGWCHNVEIVCSIMISSFCNSASNIKFFTILHSVDGHLRTSNSCARSVRWLSIFLVLLPCFEFSLSLFLRKFLLRNLPVHLAFFVLLVQGSTIVCFAINLCIKQMALNALLERKTVTIISKPEKSARNAMCGVSKVAKYVRNLSNEIKVAETPHYCWLELMQIYDKISDCYNLFNKMYGVQILFMFLTWLISTLLLICRQLSPSLKYAELYVSDVYHYTCLNSRPFFLAVMCELIVKQRSKTLAILLSVLVRGDLDEAYHDQVQAMVDLVETRRLEISANIFLVNIPTVVHFAGRAISYVVLMIQYFYKHAFDT